MANRFWVGGDGTWDASSTTHWATSSGLGGGASVPGSGDVAVFDSNSGAGTGAGGGANVTVNTNPNIAGLTFTGTSTFAGTLDFSVNNNNITIGTVGVSLTASTTRALKMGNGTWTINATSGVAWNLTTATGMTLTPGSSTLSFAGTFTANFGAQFGAGMNYNIISFGAQTGGFNMGINSLGSVNNLNLAAPIFLNANTAFTINNAINWAGSPTSKIQLSTNNQTVTVAAGSVISWASLANCKFGGSAVNATNSFDAGGNNMNGGSISPPAGNSSFIF